MVKSETDSDEKIAFSMEKACRSNNLIRNLRVIIETHQDENARNLGMSLIHLLNGNHDKALECLEYLAINHPDIAVLHRKLSEIFIYQNDFEKAVQHLEKALKLDKEDQTTKIWLGLINYEIGNEKKAKICFDSLKEDVFFLQAANTNWLGQDN